MKSKKLVLGLLAGALILLGLLAAQLYTQWRVERLVEAGVAELPPDVEVRYRAVEAGFLGSSPRVLDVTVRLPEGNPVHVDEVQFLDVDRRNDPPNHLHARALGIRQALPEDQGQTALLRRLGYRELQGSYEIRYQYDPQSRVFDLQQLEVTVDELGSLSLSMTLEDFDLAEGQATAVQPFPGFSVRELTVSYRDDSLIRRLIRQGAAERGVSEAEVVAAVEQDMRAHAARYRNPFFAELGREVGTFLREPGRLTFTASPPQAVSVMEIVAGVMFRPAELPELLRLTVKAEAPPSR